MRSIPDDSPSEMKETMRRIVRALARADAGRNISVKWRSGNGAMTIRVNRTAIYARFSSDKQSERSIDDQVALCRSYCERNELSVVGVYEDRAISGASTVNRLGWEKLMRDARGSKFDVVIAEALDRISRDQEDLVGIYKRLRFMEIEIRTVQDGKAEEIHVGVKGLVGALYLKDLAQKTKRGQAGVVRDGRHNGGRSYGYRPIAGQNGKLEIVKDEAAVVRRIFEAYMRGNSPRDIAAGLNKEGIPGPRGGPWNASTIAGSRKRANGYCRMHSTSAGSSGIGRASLKTRRLGAASADPIRNPNG